MHFDEADAVFENYDHFYMLHEHLSSLPSKEFPQLVQDRHLDFSIVRRSSDHEVSRCIVT